MFQTLLKNKLPCSKIRIAGKTNPLPTLELPFIVGFEEASIKEEPDEIELFVTVLTILIWENIILDENNNINKRDNLNFIFLFLVINYI